MENLNPKSSYQDGTEDEIVSFQDDMNDGSNMLMKNKELPYLENDKSITVDNDYDDDNTMTGNKHNNSRKVNLSNIDKSSTSNNNTNIKQNNNNVKKTNADLMKYISDSSDLFPKQFINQKNITTYTNNLMANKKNTHNYDTAEEEEENLHHGLDLNSNNFLAREGVRNFGFNTASSIGKNNPLFSSTDLGLIQPLEAKIEDNFLIENNMENDNNNEINFYTDYKRKSPPALTIEKFCMNYFGIHTQNSLISTQSFGPTQSKIKEKEFQELESNYNQVLDLLKYWQQFYLDVAKLVNSTKESKSGVDDETDYFSEDFRFSVIEEVKHLIENARNKVYHCFETTHDNDFYISGIRKEFKQNNSKKYFIDKILDFQVKAKKIDRKFNTEINENLRNLNKVFDFLEIKKATELNYEKRGLKLPKILDYDDYYNELPPMPISELKKLAIIKDEKKNKESQEATVRSKTATTEGTKVETSNKETQTDFKEKSTQPSPIRKKNNNVSNTNKNITNTKFTKEKLRIDLNKISFFFTNSAKLPKRNQSPSSNKTKSMNFNNKKNQPILRSSETQTDFTIKNIQNLEILNKECSLQLQRNQKEKDNLKKSYEKQINELIKEIDLVKKENKEKQDEIVKLNTDRQYALTEGQDESNINFFPELIPPEQTYKIFMHSVKHFKYEENIYKKYMDEEDLKSLKKFVNKMEKYLLGTSIPCQKFPKTAKATPPANLLIIPKVPVNRTSSLLKYKDNLLNGKQIKAHSQICSNISKYEKRNNSTFMKYKNAIKNIHDNN